MAVIFNCIFDKMNRSSWMKILTSGSFTKITFNDFNQKVYPRMKTLTQFKESLNSEQPIIGFSAQLKSLWYDGRGDWNQAHAQVDRLSDKQSAWVHAYLHRKEGDIWNADYWYNKARQSRPNTSLEQEWEQLVVHFLE